MRGSKVLEKALWLPLPLGIAGALLILRSGAEKSLQATGSMTNLPPDAWPSAIMALVSGALWSIPALLYYWWRRRST